MKFIWIEIVKFIKNNWLKVALGTVLFAALFTWVMSRPQTIEITEGEDSIEEGISVDSYPANFRFFVEHPDGDAFTNNILIEQYLSRLEMLEEISEATDIPLKEVVIETENTALVNYNESGEAKIIGVSRDGNTHLMEFYVNIGNEAANLAIAEYFYNYIVEDNIPFFENKNVVIFHEPRIKEFDDLAFTDGNETDNQTVRIIRNAIIGVVLGGVIILGVLLLLTFLSKRLVYSFSYSMKADDYFFLVDSQLDYEDELKEILLSPSDAQRVILIEGTGITDERLTDVLEDHSTLVEESVLNIKQSAPIDRLIYVVKENTTSREWYNKQRRLDTAYDVPTVVIQLNEK